MNQKSEYLIDLIFNKLKNNKSKEIFLERNVLRKFIFSLLEETKLKDKY